MKAILPLGTTLPTICAVIRGEESATMFSSNANAKAPNTSLRMTGTKNFKSEIPELTVCGNVG